MWQLVDNPALSIQDVEGDINCHVEAALSAQMKEEDNNINVSTQVTVEISQDKKSEFSEKFNISFPTIKGQCLNTKDFKLVKDSLVAEIENSLNPTEVINTFFNNYSDIINSSQEKQLLEIINSS